MGYLPYQVVQDFVHQQYYTWYIIGIYCHLGDNILPTYKNLVPRSRNKGLIAGLIHGNQW